MRARIYQHAKTAMQSGRAGQDNWVLAFQPTERENNDPLMGWWGSGDMQSQVRLNFGSREDAICYAEQNGIPYDVERPVIRRTPMKVYADNFRYGRSENWTH